MKPRTKLQKEVFELSKLSRKYDVLTQEQKLWAHKECLDHKGFATKSRVICMDCGDTFSPDIVSRKRATCPHCQTKLKIKDTRKSTDHQRAYFAVAEVHANYQLIRNFQIHAHYKKGKPARYYISEILQYWINEYEKVTMVGWLHNTQGYCDSWGGDWAIRVNRMRGWYYNGGKYKIYPWKYHPKSKFKAQYQKHGIDYRLDGLMFLDAMKIVPESSFAETLLKAKQYSLLAYCKDNHGIIHRYWPSIKICLRNKYKVKEVDTWIDYLDLLTYFNKDLRNAHYVCPKNLKKEHDRLVKKKRRIQEAEALKLKKQRAINDQKEYLIQKQKYFGLAFSKDNITIKVLESVVEFVEEGDKLKHCLYVNNYHTKENSLILKAEVNGESVETIEVCLKSFIILQSRGKHNVASGYNEAIVSLMEQNMHKIAAIKNFKRQKKKSSLQHLLAS